MKGGGDSMGPNLGSGVTRRRWKFGDPNQHWINRI